jgi:hypothetical protein
MNLQLTVIDDATCISAEQKAIHTTSETVAVLAVAPFMIWLATQKGLPDWARAMSAVIGVGTIAIDGWLLTKYLGVSA